MSVLTSLVTVLAGWLAPVFGGSAMAAAIVGCTLCVRLVLHPLARAAVRGERVRAELAPRLGELQRRYARDPERLRAELAELRVKEGLSPLAGCLPMVLQLPVFFAMYHLFTSDGALLGHGLLGAPLGGRWLDVLRADGALSSASLVYGVLFAVVAAVATWTFVRTRRAAAGAFRRGEAGATAVPGGAAVGRLLPLLSFGTLVTVAVVPLAAALYVVTSTTWTAVERAVLRAGRGGPAAAAAAAVRPAS